MSADVDRGNISISRSSFTKLIGVFIAALIVASFVGGYNLGGGGKTITNTVVQGNPSQPTGVQPLPLPTQQQPAAPTAPVRVSSIALENAPTQGKAGAPVTMVEFADFQCPFCGAFFSQTLPQIKTNYIDTGKIDFVIKNFPLVNLHPNAMEAANAAECANEQGKFWPYHNALFGNQTSWANLDAAGAVSAFKKFAGDFKLDTTKFNSCLDTKKYQSTIDKDSQEGSTYGVSGTPTTYVGNDKAGYTQIVGAQPFSTFQQTIDQLLKQ